MSERDTITDIANVRARAAAVAADPGMIAIENVGGVLQQVDDQGVATTMVPTGGSAPADAKYITQTPNANLSAEQALSALATGLLWNTTTTGVLTKATTAQVMAAVYNPRPAAAVLPDQADIVIDPATDKVGLYILPVISQDTTITITDGAGNDGYTLNIVRLDTSVHVLGIYKSTGPGILYAASAPGVPVTYRPFGHGGTHQWIANDKVYTAG